MIVDMVRNDLGTGVPHGHHPRADALRRRALPHRLADDQHRAGAPAAGHVARPDHAGGLPGRLHHRSPQASHHGDHRRGGDRAPRRVHRHGGAVLARAATSPGTSASAPSFTGEGRCAFGVGSGIVWDAHGARRVRGDAGQRRRSRWRRPSGEWRPPRDRAHGGDVAAGGPSGLRLFETMLLEAGGRYRYLDEHLARMAASAEALGLPFDAAEAARGAGRAGRVDARAAGRPPGSGPRPASSSSPPGRRRRRRPGPVTLLVSPFRVDPDDPLLAHKTTRRGFYDREHRRARRRGLFRRPVRQPARQGDRGRHHQHLRPLRRQSG